MKLKQVIPTILLVSLGVYVGRMTARSDINARSRLASTGAERPEDRCDKFRPVDPTSVVSADPQTQTRTATVSKPEPKLADRSQETSPSADSTASEPQLDDEELRTLVTNNFSRSGPVERSFAQDGTFKTHEELEDGKSLDRAFDATGNLIGESVQLSSGEMLAKSFYVDGQVRGANLTRADGSSIAVSFLQTGVPKARLDKSRNGIQVSSEYDDNGKILDRWKRTAEGTTTRL